MRIDSEVIRAELTRQRLPQSGMADFVGVSRQQISHILKRGTCSEDNAIKIAEYLHVHPSRIAKISNDAATDVRVSGQQVIALDNSKQNVYDLVKVALTLSEKVMDQAGEMTKTMERISDKIDNGFTQLIGEIRRDRGERRAANE